MLPERLSNGICSLRPDEEKLTFSAVFELDQKANVVNSRIGRTVIKSDRRFTYEEAQEIIETGNGEFARELATLNSLAKELRRRRYQQGKQPENDIRFFRLLGRCFLVHGVFPYR